MMALFTVQSYYFILDYLQLKLKHVVAGVEPLRHVTRNRPSHNERRAPSRRHSTSPNPSPSESSFPFSTFFHNLAIHCLKAIPSYFIVSILI